MTTPINALTKSPHSVRRLRPRSARQGIPIDLLAEAVRIFGSTAAASAWFAAPAIALEQRRPLELVDTPVGQDQIRVLLGQIRYGVYV